jgi:hypothetical protein
MPAAATTLPQLRDRLVAIGYHLPVHAAHLAAERGTPGERLERALEHTADATPLATTLRLFTIGVPVNASAAREAIGSDLTASLVECRLLAGADADGLRSNFAVAFSGEAAVVQDFIASEPAQEQDDFVTPVAGATRILSTLTVPVPGGRALEIGTGQGLPIVFASQWAKAAVGTDISERSLRCAAFTAALNNRGNVELRRGSLLDPVKPGEMFDSVLCNPPFVLSPTGATEALVGASAAGSGASFTERVVRGAPAVMADKGFAVILGNWGHASEDDWSEPVRAWVAGSGCDAMALQIRRDTPHSYASNWRREMRLLQPFREPAPLDAWLDVFAGMNASVLTFGAIVLRRRAGAGAASHWFHAEPRSTAGMQPGAGEQIRRWFDGRTRLAEAGSPAKLLDSSPRFTDAAELSGRPAVQGSGSAGLTAGTLMQRQGWPEAMRVDPVPLAVLCGCDGRKTLRQAIATAAAPHKMNAQGLERMLTPSIARWFEMGYLS